MSSLICLLAPIFHQNFPCYWWTPVAIIPYCQWSSVRLGNVGYFCCVSLIAFHHCAPYILIHWHIHLVHLLLFIHQSCSLITCSFRKNALLSSNTTATATATVTTTTTILWLFVQDYPGEPGPEETFTYLHLSWLSIMLYLLPPFTMIHSILHSYNF